MACLGNTDPSGNDNGTAIFSLTADITGMAAGVMATMVLGAGALSTENGEQYVLTETGGVRSWQQITP